VNQPRETVQMSTRKQELVLCHSGTFCNLLH